MMSLPCPHFCKAVDLLHPETKASIVVSLLQRFGTNQVLDISNRTFAFASLWFVLPYPDTSQVPERKSAATRQLVHCISHIQYLLTRLTTARRDFTHFT